MAIGIDVDEDVRNLVLLNGGGVAPSTGFVKIEPYSNTQFLSRSLKTHRLTKTHKYVSILYILL